MGRNYDGEEGWRERERERERENNGINNSFFYITLEIL